MRISASPATEARLFFPNGIAVNPGGELLIVCETGTGKLHAFDIRDPGEVGGLGVAKDRAKPRRDVACLGQ